MEELKTLFEDDYILVVDKPSGVVVNRSITHKGLTVQDYVDSKMDYLPEDEFDDEFKSRSGIVHRLDKDTSGVLVIAKTKEAFHSLLTQFKDRKVKKEYRAIVVGTIREKAFEVDAPVGRNPNNRLTMAIFAEGKPAKTSFELWQNFEVEGTHYSSLRVYPLTGRTHQIRVHLAAINFPVATDILYCTRSQYLNSSKAFARLMLHSLNIEFTHPQTGEVVKHVSLVPSAFAQYI